MLFSKWLTRCFILPYCYTHTLQICSDWSTFIQYTLLMLNRKKNVPFSEQGWGTWGGRNGEGGILDDDFREIVHILFKFSLNGSKTPCRVMGSDLFVDLLKTSASILWTFSSHTVASLAGHSHSSLTLGYKRACRSSCVIVQRTIFSNAVWRVL